MSTDFAARRSRGLVTEIVENLAASIRNGQLRPGDKLPTESEVMVQFSVSRTVVREAISGLQASELVRTRHGVGTFVLGPSQTGNFRITSSDLATVADVISVLELRIGLETEAAALAAQRRTPAHLKALTQALRTFKASIGKNSDAVPPDFRFHMEVARATGNRHFADLMTHLGTMIIPRSRVDMPESAREERLACLQRVHAEHQLIYAAIRRRDVDGARSAMRAHLFNSRDRLQNSRPEPEKRRGVKAAIPRCT